MNPIQLIKTLVLDLEDEFQHYHVWAQVRRFLSTFAATFVLQLVGGSPVMSWNWLWATLAAVAWVSVRQLYPTVPWRKVRSDVNSMVSQMEANVTFRRTVSRGAPNTVSTPTLRAPVVTGTDPTPPPLVIKPAEPEN